MNLEQTDAEMQGNYKHGKAMLNLKNEWLRLSLVTPGYHLPITQQYTW